MARTIYTRIVFDDSVESVVEPAKTDLWLNDYRENGYESGDLNPATIGSGTYPLFTTDGYHGYVESGSAYPDEKTVTYNGNVLTFKFYGNNGGISSLTIILNGSYIFNRSLGYSSASCGALWFVYDDELEQINILWSCGGNFYGRHYTSDCGAIQSVASSAIIKSILDHFVIPTYNWRSVSSISGKNGILSLSTINDGVINNGDPVTGAASDTFHSIEDSKVEELVTYATPIDSSKSESFTCVYQATPPFNALKLLVKKNSAPQDEEDADLVVNLPNPVLSTGVDEYTATNLDPLTNYFCVVQVSDSGGHYKYSDPAEVRTGFMDRNFAYTGSIQTFTAPKTGIYQLETWGAQGGNATDGTNSARGGYGAYAVGEVFLTQGDTLYINVGGQNGYGGGGNPVTNIINIIENNTYNPDATPQGIDITNNVAAYAISSGSGSWTLVNSQLSEYLLTNKTLICYMSGNIRYALTSDGIFRRSSNRPSMATHTFIPVNRQINLQKLLFKHKDYSRYGDYFQGTVGVGYVENGEFKMGATMDLDLRSTTVSDWTSKEIDLSSVPYIDYIYIVWYDGCEDFKDFEIEYI